MRWTVETLGPVVDAEIAALPAALRARLIRLAETIEAVGLEHLREPHVKHIEGKLWEMRAKRGNYTRVLCHRERASSDRPPRLRQEIAKDAAHGLEYCSRTHEAG